MQTDLRLQKQTKATQEAALKSKLFECFHGSCGHKYKHPQDLTRHVRSHLDKNFECDFCHKRFSERRLLKRHIAVHQKTYAYSCERCGAKFKHNNQLY